MRVAEQVNTLYLWSVAFALILSSCSSGAGQLSPTPTPSGELATNGEEIEPGVWRSEVRLPLKGDAPLAWVYRPSAALASKTTKQFPCVFIAPAGTDVTSGAPLNDDERDTHIPYVKAGMIVVAYEINGLSSDKAIAARDFKNARMGLDNAQGAVSWALKSVPHIDPSRLFAVGHSSAGTLALQLAQHDRRIRAGVGYAPACNFAWPDPGGSVLDIAAREDDQVPGFSAYIQGLMPQNNIASLHCPLFLFSCDDDTVVNPKEVQGFAAAVKRAGKPVKLLRQPTGGHVDGMKNFGIPSAIRWLGQFASK